VSPISSFPGRPASEVDAVFNNCIGIVDKATRDFCYHLMSPSFLEIDRACLSDTGASKEKCYPCIQCVDCWSTRCKSLLFIGKDNVNATGTSMMFPFYRRHDTDDGAISRRGFNQTTKDSILFTAHLLSPAGLSLTNYIPGVVSTFLSAKDMEEKGWVMAPRPRTNEDNVGNKALVFFRKPKENKEGKFSKIEALQVLISNDARGVNILGDESFKLSPTILRATMSDFNEKLLMRSRAFPVEHLVCGRDNVHVYHLSTVINNWVRFDPSRMLHIMATLFTCDKQGTRPSIMKYMPRTEISWISTAMLESLTTESKAGDSVTALGKPIRVQSNKDVWLALRKKDYDQKLVQVEGHWDNAPNQEELDARYKNVRTNRRTRVHSDYRHFKVKETTISVFSEGKEVKIDFAVVNTPASCIYLSESMMAQMRSRDEADRSSVCSCPYHETAYAANNAPIYNRCKDRESDYKEERDVHKRLQRGMVKFSVLNSNSRQIKDVRPVAWDDGGDNHYTLNGVVKQPTDETKEDTYDFTEDTGERAWKDFNILHDITDEE
jgi:hypothetical protein